MTSRLERSTQVYLSCIFDLKHLCYHVRSYVQNWSFQNFSDSDDVMNVSWKFLETSQGYNPLPRDFTIVTSSQLWNHGRLTSKRSRLRGRWIYSPSLEDVVPVRCSPKKYFRFLVRGLWLLMIQVGNPSFFHGFEWCKYKPQLIISLFIINIPFTDKHSSLSIAYVRRVL